MNLRSSLYVGNVFHHRLRPRTHKLHHRAFWMLIDLDEIHEMTSRLRLFSYNRFNLASFYDRDHGDGSNLPLRCQVEERLRSLLATVPSPLTLQAAADEAELAIRHQARAKSSTAVCISR